MGLKVLLFLGTSCISAIAAVGSVFELTGTPRLGVSLTWLILILSIPATVVLFQAALKEARASQ